MKRIFVIDESEVVREALAFNQPRQSAIALEEKTKTPVGEIHGRCAKRQTRFIWRKTAASGQSAQTKNSWLSIKRSLFYCHSCHFLPTLDGVNVPVRKLTV